MSRVISVSWFECNNDLTSDLSLVVLKKELLELLDEHAKQTKVMKKIKEKSDLDELTESALEQCEYTFKRLVEILESLNKKEPSKRKKFEPIYQETVATLLNTIYYSLCLKR